jgi:dTDP-glucose 4,6-dehydratase
MPNNVDDAPAPVVVTGGAGFIGSALVRHLLEATERRVINVDALKYSGHRASLTEVEDHPRYRFIHADICDGDTIDTLLAEEQPGAIMHLAAESHVDRSIDDPLSFVRSNVMGTATLLDRATDYWSSLPAARQDAFRFLHVSTDEVFGELGDEGYFTEDTPYDPHSPYSASKASADHFCRAWHDTYGLPVLISNCANNYGPRQFPEKLIPVVILNAFAGDPIPVYGDGSNVRDWLHVDDHARALLRIVDDGRPGETYNVGADTQRTNLELVRALCERLDRHVDDPAVESHTSLITFVEDRPGHDHRYAIDPSKIQQELGWRAEIDLDEGLDATVRWYLDNLDWCRAVLEDAEVSVEQRHGTRTQSSAS